MLWSGSLISKARPDVPDELCAHDLAVCRKSKVAFFLRNVVFGMGFDARTVACLGRWRCGNGGWSETSVCWSMEKIDGICRMFMDEREVGLLVLNYLYLQY